MKIDNLDINLGKIRYQENKKMKTAYALKIENVYKETDKEKVVKEVIKDLEIAIKTLKRTIEFQDKLKEGREIDE